MGDHRGIISYCTERAIDNSARYNVLPCVPNRPIRWPDGLKRDSMFKISSIRGKGQWLLTTWLQVTGICLPGHSEITLFKRHADIYKDSVYTIIYWDIKLFFWMWYFYSNKVELICEVHGDFSRWLLRFYCHPVTWILPPHKLEYAGLGSIFKFMWLQRCYSTTFLYLRWLDLALLLVIAYSCLVPLEMSEINRTEVRHAHPNSNRQHSQCFDAKKQHTNHVL